MGGVAGGLASLLGGAGREAADYGQQVRGLLEQRRYHLTDVLTQAANQESDRQRQAVLFGYASELLGGGDMSKILPKVHKTLSDNFASDAALAQLTGGTPQQPTTVPGPAAPGQTPGTAPQPGMAAAPGTSPVQPQQQQQPQQGTIANLWDQMKSDPLSHTSGGRAMMLPIYQTQITQAAQLERDKAIYDMERGHRQDSLPDIIKADDEMLAEPNLDPAFRFSLISHKAQARAWAADPKIESLPQPPSLYGLATLGRARQQRIDVTNLSPEEKTRIGAPPDAKGEWIIDINYRGEPMGTAVGQGFVAPSRVDMPNGGIGTYSPNNPGAGVSAVPGAVAPSQIQQHLVTANNGQQRFISPWQSSQGGQGTPTPGFNPAYAPQYDTHLTPISTVDANGNPITKLESVTGVKQRGTPSGAGQSIPPIAGPSSTNQPTQPNAGGGSRDFPKFSNLQLTPGGQKDVTDIDNVLGQITRIKQEMEKAGLDKRNDLGYYTDYLKYMHGGMDSRYQDLWTSLSFEAMRSAAAVLKGNAGSRAYPIISRALEHTPNLEPSLTRARLPDTPSNMYHKLVTMESILSTGRQQILKDEQKSGRVPPIDGTTGSQSPVEQWGRGPDGKLRRQ